MWQDPAEPVLWVLDGGDLVAALLRATGHTERRPDEKPLRLDVDTGGVVGPAARADHEILDLPTLLGAVDAEEHLAELPGEVRG